MKIWQILKLLLYKIYWTLIALPFDYTIYFIKFSILKTHKRSTKILITSKPKRVDTKGEMERLERVRDNMAYYLNSIPDQCIIELSEKVYCTNVK